MNNQYEILSGAVLDDAVLFSLTEVCYQCHIDEVLIHDMLNHGILDVVSQQEGTIYFTYHAIQRIQSTVRLQRDFEMNLQAAALVLELRDEIEKLRNEINMLRRIEE